MGRPAGAAVPFFATRHEILLPWERVRKRMQVAGARENERKGVNNSEQECSPTFACIRKTHANRPPGLPRPFRAFRPLAPRALGHPAHAGTTQRTSKRGYAGGGRR